MTRRSKVWLVLAVLFTIANFGAGAIAARQGEPVHAGGHAALLLLGAYLVRRARRKGESDTPALADDYTDRLTNIERSVDAVATEIERVGEGQRFMTRFFAEHGIPQAVADDPAGDRTQDAGGDGSGTIRLSRRSPTVAPE